jgi:hypothetical protein
MSTRKRGYYTLSLGGKDRTMHFSMNFWGSFCDILGISLEQIGTAFANGISITTLRTIIYSGLWAFDKEEGNEIDYNEFKVGAWLEDLEAAKLEEIVSVMFESKILGNDLNMGIQRNVKRTTKQGK